MQVVWSRLPGRADVTTKTTTTNTSHHIPHTEYMYYVMVSTTPNNTSAQVCAQNLMRALYVYDADLLNALQLSLQMENTRGSLQMNEAPAQAGRLT